MNNMHWGIVAAIFCLISNTECSNPGQRSHNNGPDWISDCYDHAPNHLMNPFCPTQGCSTPVPVAHAHVDYNVTFYAPESKVTYTCEHTYELMGPSTITCIQDPTKTVYVWTPGPTCSEKECGPLPQIANGMHAQTYNRTISSTVAYTCNRGFNLIGQETVTCVLLTNQATATWTERPSCEFECGPVPQIPNGKHEQTYNRTINSTVTYNCNRGYKLIGQEAVACVLLNQSYATWTEQPSCVLDCGLPQKVMYANISGSNGTLEGDVTTYECQTHAELLGEQNVTCLHTGNWSMYPTCIPGCGLPPVVANGSPRPGYTMTVNSTAAYTCERGYQLVGEEVITCSFIAGNEIPQWTTPPMCTIISAPKCPAIPAIVNGSVFRVDSPKPTVDTTTTAILTTTTTAANFTTTADLNTMPDLTTTPDFTTTTQSDLITVSSTDASTAVTMFADETTNMMTTPGQNGFHLDKYDLGTNVTYQCNKGYAFNGSNSIVCELNAVWSALPQCVGCGELQDSNGKFQLGNLCNDSRCFCDEYKCECGVETYYNDTERICNETNEPGYRLVCNEKFRLVGDAVIKCQRNLTWTAIPRCECIRKSVDMVFIIDSSGSVGLDGFNQTKEFLIDMMNRFPANRTRFGLMFFSDRVAISFDLNTFINDKTSMIEHIRNISYEGAATHTLISSSLCPSYEGGATHTLISSCLCPSYEGGATHTLISSSLCPSYEGGATHTLISSCLCPSYEGGATHTLISRCLCPSYEGGATHTYEALQVARESMFTGEKGMRPNSSHIAILVSDGLSGDLNKTKEQGQLLKDSGVTVYTVGVGSFADNLDELRSVASKNEYVFEVKNYENIDEVAGPLADATCGASTED
ncbi:sushi, von Willebrand factor type A, EGF and pentraxin domain-containing protein 1-like isoform X3 [Dreissena polymorpha]|uniref:sushi, von Willebrand factor type A, EGF and pentraxin domain-containing protein 1-like isoform X3 n=1 Tax=Dreissena polymorpha TaxID=45954 RepID=UPI002263E044|nr:sushi, von Willebrand factor type A, EGF and pentraxin domain-containing protein 1-like isoform X3 [Dreissena polymorpha]